MSMVPVVHDTKDGERVAELMRWGLLPHWAKDEKLAAKLNNARVEGMADKPSFRQAVRRRRCLLPASGFYEWQATPSGKQPWYISPRNARRQRAAVRLCRAVRGLARRPARPTMPTGC